jgi:signal transduction histidine kinase/putative methionine-R-sulfoxide reductase with GAF domain
VRQRDLLDLFDLTYASEEGLEAWLEHALDKCAHWFNASGASIFLRDESRGDFIVAARSGTEARSKHVARISSGVGIAGTSIANKVPLLINDPKDHPLLQGKISYRRSAAYSAMIVPLLLTDSTVIGVLNVSRKDEPFGEDDLRLARTIGNHIGLAVTNAKLVERLSDSLEETKHVKDKLQSVIDNIGVGILVLNAQHHVTEFNEAALSLGDIASSPGTLDAMLSSLPRSLRHEIEDAIHTAFEGEEHQTRAIEKGTGKTWSVVASPLPDGGAVLALNDVTEHEHALKELDRVRRLAEIGQMTAAIAHEIRNPLASISSAAQFVQSEPECAQEFGQIIECEALKLNALCDEFLNFAKPIDLELRPIRLNELVSNIARMHASEFEAAEVALDVISDPSDPIVMGDSLRLEQACRNLLLNALQACDSGQRVTIAVEGTGFRVTDGGRGIDPEVRQNLFTPFFTTRSKGTGLGLSNVKKIVDAHHGSIDLQSTPQAGTTFTIRLERRSA